MILQKAEPESTVTSNAIQGAEWKAMLRAALESLRAHREEVNALNVFPVPDGDTGTNMTLTMQAAWKEIEGLESDHAGEIMRAAAHGAIRGARGNSGVILSQIFRGMADAAGGLPAWDANALAHAFRQGQRAAYQGVMQPVEGTILTIIRAMADASEHAAALSDDIGFLLTTSLSKAREALAQTPEMLPILQEAGVVDAGGAGLVYLLEGVTHAVTGEAMPSASSAPAAQPRLEALPDEWGYDIQFLIYDAQPGEEAIRRRLIDLGGESIVVGRSGRVTKVHVHGENPGPFLAYGASLGLLDDVVVENMTLQTLRRKGIWTEEGPERGAGPVASARTEDFCIPVVAVTAGEGFAEVFRSLGACHIVAGGQTMNPSTDELLQAIARVPEPEVILLPNNKNILMAARQAAELSDKAVYVVESRTLPQGVAVLFAYRPQASAEENAEAMRRALADVHTIEVTEAVRDAAIDGVQVQKGAIIALVDGRLCCTGDDPGQTALQALETFLSEGDYEMVTVYVGQPMAEADARALAQAIEARHPDVEVEVVAGGQPHYHLIISVE
ncbi:MAG TPA: DAK2 domain-containing protein [Anaerolineae bacterium]|nr:DAK2 domain-containing protein [Anaerolineae bacterium]